MLKVAWNTNYSHPLPKDHRFPMIKYELLPQQLLREGTIEEENLFQPNKLQEDLILDVHTKAYWMKLKALKLTRQEIRRTGFPLSSLLVRREIEIAHGTLQCCHYALQYGVAMNVAGGTHHAFSDKGEGFCLLNDIAIAANYLIKHMGIKKVLVIDLDVHQGNGTAEIFKHEPNVFTFSMHGKNNYPLKKELSDLDLPLDDGVSDVKYLFQLQKALENITNNFKPEFIFYQAGVDILNNDQLGRLSVSIAGCKNRDEIVFRFCRENKIPIVVSMGGGYSKKISDILEAHSNTYRVASELYF